MNSEKLLQAIPKITYMYSVIAFLIILSEMELISILTVRSALYPLPTAIPIDLITPCPNLLYIK